MLEMIPLSEDREDAVYRCIDCDWRASLEEENSGDDHHKRPIQHHVETAHTVVLQSAIGQDTITPRPTTRTRPRWLGPVE